MLQRVLVIIFLVFILILIVNLIVSFIIHKIPYQSQKAQISPVGWSLTPTTDTLSLEQRIGQLFIIGFEGKVLSPEVENLIREIHPGGILLLKRNIENEKQLKELINSPQEIALENTGLPLFIVVDQEGGIISRIDWLEKTPQSEIRDIEQAYQVGQNRGRELKELGINLNLAPMVDVTLPTDFIFERSFQKNPFTIGELVEALVQGQKQAGIFVALKHFPGYGGISFNPEEELASLEKIPEISQFQKAAQAFPEMIMTSNVIYKEIDEKYPFSFSRKGIQFLKENLGDEILIISDDLDQNSLLNKFSLKEIVALPFKAGTDILIFSGWRVSVIEGVRAFRKAVKAQEIPEERIDQSVLKIIELKQKI